MSDFCGALVGRDFLGLRITATCARRTGHEGEHVTDLTRVRLRWEQEAEEPADGVVCRNGEHD